MKNLIRRFEEPDKCAVADLMIKTSRYSINSTDTGSRTLEDIIGSPEMFADIELAAYKSGFVACFKGETIGYALLRSSLEVRDLKSIAAKFLLAGYGSRLKILSKGLKTLNTMKLGRGLPRKYRLVSIGLDEEFTNLGIGTELLENLESTAGIHHFGAVISKTNTRSRNFFRKHGYELQKEMPFLNMGLCFYAKELNS